VRIVVVAGRDEQQVIVSKGVKEGDEVIVDPPHDLNEATRLRVTRVSQL
jgi:multidrug efflux pump subunit AcrA (membrane-fusion protein)